LHIGLNLPPKDNLREEDKSSAPKVSFIRRFHCNTHVGCNNLVQHLQSFGHALLESKGSGTGGGG